MKIEVSHFDEESQGRRSLQVLRVVACCRRLMQFSRERLLLAQHWERVLVGHCRTESERHAHGDRNQDSRTAKDALEVTKQVLYEGVRMYFVG